MSTLREAAQQALEALVVAWQQNPHWQITEAMNALRAALAQQEQEPVAWMYQWKNGTDRTRHVSTAKWPESNGWAEWPLFTHPPRREWVSLTDEEIDAVLFPYCDNKYEWIDYREVACAVEQALKEKNQ